MDTMYFSWQESPVEIDPGVQLPQFVLEGKILYDCSQNYTAGQSSLLHVFQLIIVLLMFYCFSYKLHSRDVSKYLFTHSSKEME